MDAFSTEKAGGLKFWNSHSATIHLSQQEVWSKCKFFSIKFMEWVLQWIAKSEDTLFVQKVNELVAKIPLETKNNSEVEKPFCTIHTHFLEQLV